MMTNNNGHEMLQPENRRDAADEIA